jgi:AraC-like DNA-binding protein
VTRIDSCKFSLERPDLLRAHASAQGFDPHLHDTFSVVLLHTGSATLRLRRGIVPVHAGDVVICNPFEVHGVGSPHASVEYDVLYPSIRFARECLGKAVRGGLLPVLRTILLRPSRTTHALFEAVGARAPTAVAAENALSGLFRECKLDDADLPGRSFDAVNAACQIIHDQYAQPLDTERLARCAGLHTSHFIRVFHRLTGLAPQTYLRQVRVARARQLICAGAELADVAYMTGFFDQPHLTREFKKIHGITPGRFAREVNG